MIALGDEEEISFVQRTILFFLFPILTRRCVMSQSAPVFLPSSSSSFSFSQGDLAKFDHFFLSCFGGETKFRSSSRLNAYA